MPSSALLINRDGFDYSKLSPEVQNFLITATQEIIKIKKQCAEDIVRLGFILIETKSQLKYGEFQEWYEKELGWSGDTIERCINVAKCFGEIPQIAVFEQSALYLLSKPKTPEPARQEAVELAESGEKISHSRAKEIIAKYKEDNSPEPKKGPQFNSTNENIDWASWTWNPVTGCNHGCKYCYARDMANRFYKEKFEPTFRPYRLKAPQNMPVIQSNHIGDKNVFVCSMADLFGEWVPQEWIDVVLGTVRNSPQWNYIFLTKNPERLTTIQWPDNAWVGTTVEVQARVKRAEEAFKNVDAVVRFVSCEPLSEEITFSNLNIFDWVIIGARSRSSGAPAMQPKWEWIYSLMNQAKRADCMVYCKPNLNAGIKEYPAK